MSGDEVVALTLAVLLTGYLVVALLFPEHLQMTSASWLLPGGDVRADGR